jgi:16S rRNA (cytosine967-C5)-methyltransferase
MTASRRSSPFPANVPLTSRQAAWIVLSDNRFPAVPARDDLDRLVADNRLPADYRGSALELILGVLRHRLTLSHVLGNWVAGGWRRVDRPLRPMLLLGAYQSLYQDEVPAFAAIYESVELAKSVAGPRGSRFVNALLRRLQREIEHRRIDADQADATRSIPIDPAHSCQFREPILPNPARHPTEHLALATSHPVELVADWIRVFGLKTARQITFAGLARPPVVLRPNRMRTEAAALVQRLAGEGFQACADPQGRAVDVPVATSLMTSAAYREGLFQPQDRTAMAVVEAMNPQPGQVIVDLCAGLGTKTTQLAESMNDEGLVIACDKENRRLEAIRGNAERLGLTSIRVVHLDQVEALLTTLDRIDWILVDAPCSNTGVLARRPEARYRFKRGSLTELQAIQVGLLEHAVRQARPGTRLAYSTCSLEPEENEHVTALFAAHQPRWQRLNACRVLPSGDNRPGRWHDGGYWALWAST